MRVCSCVPVFAWVLNNSVCNLCLHARAPAPRACVPVCVCVCVCVCAQVFGPVHDRLFFVLCVCTHTDYNDPKILKEPMFMNNPGFVDIHRELHPELYGLPPRQRRKPRTSRTSQKAGTEADSLPESEEEL